MWNTPVLFFEDEDEEALISQFVELSAKYPNRDALELTQHIFRHLRDPVLRAGAAAIEWSRSIEVQERIRNFSLTGDESEEIASKREKLKVLESIYKDKNTSAKDRIAAIQLHAQMQGELIKAIEQSNTDKRTPPQVVSAVGDFYAKPN